MVNNTLYYTLWHFYRWESETLDSVMYWLHLQDNLQEALENIWDLSIYFCTPSPYIYASLEKFDPKLMDSMQFYAHQTTFHLCFKWDILFLVFKVRIILGFTWSTEIIFFILRLSYLSYILFLVFYLSWLRIFCLVEVPLIFSGKHWKT